MTAKTTAELSIEAMGTGGDGIASVHGGPVYAPFTLPGEKVLATIEGDRARLIEALEASPARVAPVCRHFGECGGCALQHWRREDYLDWKAELVAAALRQRGIEAAVEPAVSGPVSSRRRAVFTAQKQAGDLRLGFRRTLSHDLIDIGECPVLAPALSGRLAALRHVLGALLASGAEARVTALACDNGLDLLVEGAAKTAFRPFDARGVQHALEGVARLTLAGAGPIYQAAEPELRMSGVVVRPPPGAFVQACEWAERRMSDLALEGIGKAKAAADLFCGLGAFAFALARHARITAVEGEARALSALDAAARKAKGLKPIAVLRRDLARDPLSPPELNRFDAVLFDPPRAGAQAQARELARSKVGRAIAVSCHPATFARDASILIDGGFRLGAVHALDQFIFSPHVEIVAHFER